MKEKLLVLLIFIFLGVNFYSKAKDAIEMPKNIVVISQSCSAYGLFISAIDLDKNELIVLVFYGRDFSDFELIKIIRTGIKVDSTKQLTMIGKDNPFIKLKN